MATVMSPLELATLASEWSRPPLSPVTNSPPQTPTPIQCKTIRRKSSLICRADSSEELTSSHESIFRAERFSNSDSESNDIGLFPKTANPTIRSTSSVNLVGNNENVRNGLLAPTVGNTPILYGHGTALSTIVEQKSSTTMSPKDSSTPPEPAPVLSISNLLGHRNSFELPSTITIRSPRRRRSFSADDLYFIKRSYHDACAVIERESNCILTPYNVYAGARTPVLPPIERLPTPPGMPSWTEAQNNPIRNINRQHPESSVRTRSSFQRFFSGLSNEASSRRSATIGTQSQNNSTPTTLPSQVPPRFHPIRSGHGTGPLNSHPFHRAARADVKSDAAPAAPRITTPPPSRRVIRVNGKAKIRKGYLPNITGRARISVSTSSRLHNLRKRQETQCPHRQSRTAPLRVLKQRTVPTIPAPHHQASNTIRSAPSVPEGASAQESAAPLPAVDPQVTATIRSALVSPRIPTTAGASLPRNPIISITNAERIRQSQTCWKCRIIRIIHAIDSFWDEATALFCGIFCCIDVDRSTLGSPLPPGRRVLSLAG